MHGASSVDTDSKAKKRNFQLGVAQGISLQAGASFIRPSTFLAAFIHNLSGSCYLCGLIFTVQRFSMIVPQLLGARYLKSLTYKKPFLITLACLRGACWVILAIVAYIWGTSNPTLVIIVFFVCISIYYTASGLGVVAFNDFTRKVIDRKVLGSFFGWRALLGGAAAVLTAIVARWVLSRMELFARPTQHTILFMLAAVFFGVQIFNFTSMKEPPTEAVIQREPITDFLKEIKTGLKGDPWFRILLQAKLLLGASLLANPFYVTFATEELGQSLMDVGTFTILLVVAGCLGGFLLGKLSDRKGQKFAFIIVAILCLLPPFFGILAGTFNRSWILATFFSLGLTIQPRVQMERNYMLQVAPEGSIATVSALQNTLVAPLVLFPILGAYIIGIAGHKVLFLLVMALTVLGIVSTVRLPDPQREPKKS